MSGISNVSSALCNEAGSWIIYQSDRFGFNNPPDVWREHETDFIALGDSFVHGHCLSRNETIVGRFREAFPKAVNLGWHRSKPLYQYAILREYG